MQLVTWIAWTILVVGFASKSGTQELRWREFSSKGGEYAVSFPCRPKITSEDIEITPELHRPLWKTVCGLPHEDHAFFVGHIEIPEEIELDEELTQEMLDAGVENVAAEAGNTILRVTPTSFRGFPAREVEARSGQHALHMHLFVANQRFYTLVFGRAPGSTPDERARFFDSFRLTTPSPTPPSP